MTSAAPLKRCGELLKKQTFKGETMKVSDILTDQSRWTQGASARNKRGRWCDVLSEDAVRFCLRGAAARVYSGQALDNAISAIARAIGFDDDWGEYLEKLIEAWNDDKRRTLAEVRQVIERAGV
jgi:hypothetical protein